MLISSCYDQGPFSSPSLESKEVGGRVFLTLPERMLQNGLQFLSFRLQLFFPYSINYVIKAKYILFKLRAP